MSPWVAAAHAQAFRWIDTPFSGIYPSVLAMSADGSSILGRSDATPSGSFRWSEADGTSDIGFLPGTLNTEPQGISAGGGVVVGAIRTGSGYAPFIWTLAQGLQEFGNPAPSQIMIASAVNADGSVIAGQSDARAVAWRMSQSNTATMMLLERFPGATYSAAIGLSRDGKVAVGSNSLASGGGHAVRWNAEDGHVEELIGTQVAQGSESHAVNRDGSIVAGVMNRNGLVRAFRWSSTTGVADLGGVDDATYLHIHGINDAGTVLVGTSIVQYSRGIIWRSGQGFTEINEFMGEIGLSQRGWWFSAVVGVSADGRTIGGWAEEEATQVRRAWLATIPSGCVADFDASGSVTMQDLFSYLAAWFSGAASADVSAPDGIAQSDLVEYVRAWFAGC